MKDKRNEVLATILLTYSVDLQAGEKIMLEIRGQETLELAKEIIRQATQLGGVPFWYYNDSSVTRPFIQDASEAQFEAFGKLHLKLMKECDAWLGLYAPDNVFEFADVEADQMTLYTRLYIDLVHVKERVRNTKWCFVTFPTNSKAQLSQMSQEAYEEFYYDVCCLHYSKMSKAMDPLVELMERTDRVRIVGPGTDLSFSIEGLPVVKCDGKENIPDGEVFTAPVRDSLNGHITFNTPALERGFLFHDIRLEFESGKVVHASCQAGTDRLNEILDVDEGARYIGEFALGLNPFIHRVMNDALFDEKIAGSLHLALGQCDRETPNGNDSAIHWDIVLMQTEEYGGGELYFDGELIRRDGKFVDEELEQSLSAEALRAL
ncbi:MAG: aminopeptidase [Anaerolineae bacterium]|nr:aminopeptidase [Anaerolineae bacterium]NIN99066.1 aminopeptidase [Anaerolineae bacterium]NIQ81914.1 aminopeptidase [Anaerolineae bacterium]